MIKLVRNVHYMLVASNLYRVAYRLIALKRERWTA